MTRHLVVVGGGVIGLSIAWHASHEDFTITLIDRGPIGRESSWASAGMLPYVNPETARHPLERLAAVSHALHAQWHREIVDVAGIDYEYEVAGTIHLARTRAEQASLRGVERSCLEERIPVQWLNHDDLTHELPSFALPGVRGDRATALKRLADAQLRSPRFLQALESACRKRGVRIISDVGAVTIRPHGDCVAEVDTETKGRIGGDQFVVAAGAWSAQLLAPIGVVLKIVPIRGQMAQFRLAERPFVPAIYEGGNYMVARRDGRVLVGSTIEDVGFNPSTTPEAVDSLSAFAASILPELAGRRPELAWAGLRPATFDGFPYIGRISEMKNALVATGHFRSGMLLAPATAVAICRILQDQPETIDLSPFRTSRG